MTATIVRGDALHLPLADNTVDLIVTSPPYFALRSYQDGGQHYAGQIGSESSPQAWLEALWAATAEMVRVLKPSGSIFVNLGDKYAGSVIGDQTTSGLRDQSYVPKLVGKRLQADRGGMRPKSLMLLPERYRIGCVDRLSLIARAVIIWDKPNGLPESVTDRVRRSHEDWVHLTKAPRYYSAVDEVREPQITAGSNAAKFSTKRQGMTDGTRGTLPFQFDAPNPLGKLPGSVWQISSEPLQVPPKLGVDHFAAYPTEWPRRIIAGWSPPGGTVADPFAGTGTTVLVADVLGRHGIGVDLSADYCRLAAWRCSDPASRAKAARVDKPPPVIDGQLDLLGGAW